MFFVEKRRRKLFHSAINVKEGNLKLQDKINALKVVAAASPSKQASKQVAPSNNTNIFFNQRTTCKAKAMATPPKGAD